MDTLSVFVELVKASFPFLVGLATTYVVMNLILGNEKDKRNVDYNLRIQELANSNRSEMLPIRLQAYERLVLLLERLTPQNLIVRSQMPDMNVAQLQFTMVQNIRTEYEHNITQQLYVSTSSWALISASVEEMITVINSIGRTLSPDAPAIELSRSILQYFLEGNHQLTLHKAIEELKIEAQRLF